MHDKHPMRTHKLHRGKVISGWSDERILRTILEHPKFDRVLSAVLDSESAEDVEEDRDRLETETRPPDYETE
jgi:hypothetical protein